MVYKLCAIAYPKEGNAMRGQPICSDLNANAYRAYKSGMPHAELFALMEKDLFKDARGMIDHICLSKRFLHMEVSLCISAASYNAIRDKRFPYRNMTEKYPINRYGTGLTNRDFSNIANIQETLADKFCYDLGLKNNPFIGKMPNQYALISINERTKYMACEIYDPTDDFWTNFTGTLEVSFVGDFTNNINDEIVYICRQGETDGKNY